MPRNRFFSKTYEESRAGFRNQLKEVKKYWPNVRLETYHIGSEEEDNTTDILTADASEEKKDLLIITAGEHGIEGFTGSALLQLFIEEYLPSINPETTGLRLVHAVNPWGMRHFRRVTENNIDLNRNYIKDWEKITGTVNEEFVRKKNVFIPSGPIEDLHKQKEKLYFRLKEAFTTEELASLKDTPSGQYKFKTGVFYGGNEYDEPARELKNRYVNWGKNYDHLVHMDIHSGGGPKDDLSLIFTKADGRSEHTLREELSYDQVMKSPEMYGDSNLFLQKAVQEKYPEKKIFVCLFEFGTIGETRDDFIFCTKTMINENQLYFKGATKKGDIEDVQRDFTKLFYPEREEWQELVIEKGRKGLNAVLASERIQLREVPGASGTFPST
ncbi:M14 family metallopeptidase [Alteribacter aurantiacus]|uniref:M14 family metallopeptidase n=1 Tax=Alteribacter aurantiacus TaxID=254410 RepID=UPI0003FDC94D|nr:M14 family metallopeptidase [Alteribacter aurantiacus]